MADIEASPEVEAEVVRAAVHKIRETDRNVSKKYPVGERTTFWDADESRLTMIDSKAIFTTKFGQSIILTGIPGFKDEYVTAVDVDNIVSLQFCSEEMIKMFLLTHEVFRPEGLRFLGCFEGEVQVIRDYCEKMDKVIREEAFKLRDKCVKNIFNKIYKEMGGDMIPKTDRVGRRMKFLGEVSALYNEDKKKWGPFLGKLGLLKRA